MDFIGLMEVAAVAHVDCAATARFYVEGMNLMNVMNMFFTHHITVYFQSTQYTRHRIRNNSSENRL